MNILLAVDGSEYSARVVEALLTFSARLREMPKVHVLYVHLPIPIGFATRHVAREIVDAYYHEEGLAVVQPVAERLRAAGLDVEQHVRVGSPGETIANAVNDLECDAVWMGTHGRGAVTQALLGSVAARVVALAHRPVTLVR
ncbi:universal stress protein [Uliginosibacterium aquaticum]|uniref:Universal stress protein n=1 Tax=Uliginosibacterium aquaticum TaxID=2731212 RepID=A0ABX2IH05_9RHOO|nr:universal stress protein [Uliginosibacterium aquaticum]NSL55567.1 universal stress protein [Uliginosibacterium aquaticum]